MPNPNPDIARQVKSVQAGIAHTLDLIEVLAQIPSLHYLARDRFIPAVAALIHAYEFIPVELMHRFEQIYRDVQLHRPRMPQLRRLGPLARLELTLNPHQRSLRELAILHDVTIPSVVTYRTRCLRLLHERHPNLPRRPGGHGPAASFDIERGFLDPATALALYNKLAAQLPQGDPDPIAPDPMPDDAGPRATIADAIEGDFTWGQPVQ